MNKKIILSIFGMFLLIGIVTAGLIGISTWEKDTVLEKATIDQIKEFSLVTSINVEIGKIQCDNNQCWASLYQKDLIQTEWRRDKNYCTKYDQTAKNIVIDTDADVCLEYKDYTLEENQKDIQNFLEEKLKTWSEVQKERKSKVITETSDVGLIKEKSIGVIK